MTDLDLDRAAGYLYNLFRHAVRPTDKTYAGAQAFQLLAAWGRYHQAQEVALELLNWLEACPQKKEHPSCMNTVLTLCSEGAERLDDIYAAVEYEYARSGWTCRITSSLRRTSSMYPSLFLRFWPSRWSVPPCWSRPLMGDRRSAQCAGTKTATMVLSKQPESSPAGLYDK